MAHRESFLKNTKNYQILANRFEERLQEMVEDLVADRNGMKVELAAKNAKLMEFERLNVQLLNQNEVLKEQLVSARENFNTTDYFAKRVMNIAQKLAHDNIEMDIERDPLQALLPPPSVPASNAVTPQAQPILNASNAASNNMEVAGDDVEVVILDNNDDEDNAVRVHEAGTADISAQQSEPQMSVVLNL